MTPFFETKLGTLYQGDCMDLMAALTWHNIDLILADLPFGSTANEWDQPLPFPQLWWLYGKMCKAHSPILLFGIEPFSSKCRLSNLANYKCDWKSIKSHSSGRHLAKYHPLQRVDDVMVFGNGGTTFYNPQMIPLEKPIKENCDFGASDSLGNGFSEPKKVIRTQRYPINVLPFDSPPRRGSLHPAGKSLDLCKYLIETYSLPDQVVLDNCAGSGTTLLAAEQSRRRWIGIEQDVEYCNKIRQRFEDEKP